MVTRSPSFDEIPSERARRRNLNESSPRMAYVDGWGRDEQRRVPMRRSASPTAIAALVGAAIGVTAVGLYAGGMLGGATLHETPPTASAEPSFTINPEYQRAIWVQAHALANSPDADLSATAVSPQTADSGVPAGSPESSASASMSAAPQDEDAGTSLDDADARATGSGNAMGAPPPQRRTSWSASAEARMPESYRESVPPATTTPESAARMDREPVTEPVSPQRSSDNPY